MPSAPDGNWRRCSGQRGKIAGRPAAAPGLWFRDASLIPSVADWLGGQTWCGALLTRDPAVLPQDASVPLSLLGSAHPRSADLVVTFAGSESPDEWGLPGHAPFDAPDVPEGGGMHGGLHRAELAVVAAAAPHEHSLRHERLAAVRQVLGDLLQGIQSRIAERADLAQQYRRLGQADLQEHGRGPNG